MDTAKSFNKSFPKEFILGIADGSSHFLEEYLKEIKAPEKLIDLSNRISWLNYLSRNGNSPVVSQTDEIHFAIQDIIQDIYALGGKIDLSEDSIGWRLENGEELKPSLRIVENEVEV